MPIKSVKQNFKPNILQIQMMETFRQMVNECIKIGLENNCSTLRKLSLLSYSKLTKYKIVSYYKLTAISQACGILSSLKRCIKKGKHPKSPYVKNPYLVSCYGFKINGMLLSFSIGNRELAHILLNDYVRNIISQTSVKVKSFTMTLTSLSLNIQRQIELITTTKTIGIDRNLRNVTFGNDENIIQVNTSELLKIKENYHYVTSSIKRNDWRIKKKIKSKLGLRQTRRIQQRLHRISKYITKYASENKTMIIFEDLKGIRKLYQKGNGQGRKFRRKLNSWPFYELERQVDYKSAWQGIPIKFVNPKCTSTLCPRCGGRLQGDKQRRRDLWCGNCKQWRDRDVVAAMNVAYKGLMRFVNSQGDTNEAMRGNPDSNPNRNPVILRVDVSKLGLETPNLFPQSSGTMTIMSDTLL